MKKILSIPLLAAAALLMAGCTNEEDDLFSQSAAERLNEASDIYTQRLASSPAGWLMEYYPTSSTFAYSGRGYLLADDFNADGSVTVGMNNVFSGNQYREATSAWQVITDDGPVLSFNSYNQNMHVFSTPEDMQTLLPAGTTLTNQEEDATGQGTGVGGDYEFVITDAPEDGSYIMLKGKKRGTYTRLTPIPAGTSLQDYLTDVQNFEASIFVDGAPNPNYMTLGTQAMQIDSSFTGIMRIFPQGADAISTQTLHPFLFSKHDGDYYLRFRDAITTQGDSTVQEFRYDSVAGEFTSVEDNLSKITGYPRGQFISYALLNGHSFQLNTSSVMSDKMKAVIQALADDFSSRRVGSRRMSFRNLSLRLSNDTTVWQLNFRTTTNTNREYVFNRQDSLQDISLTYDKPFNADAETLLGQMTTVGDVMQALSGDFTVTAEVSNFLLTRLRLTSKADPDLWFVVAYSR